MIDFTKPVDQLKNQIESMVQDPSDEPVYEVAVIGLGSIGSAICYNLAKTGINVLGIEKYGLSHDLGSHGGQTRIYRKAYFEHPDYVPLLETSYNEWASLEKEAGVQLLNRCGLAYIGPANGELIEGVSKSSNIYSIPVIRDRDSNTSSFKQFKVPEHDEIFFEPDAGFVHPERAILTFSGLSLKEGANLLLNTTVISWKENSSYHSIETDKGVYKSKKLIFCSGAWGSELLPELKDLLKVSRQVIAWFKPDNYLEFTPDNFPAWTIEKSLGQSIYYGFPYIEDEFYGSPIGLKLGYHKPGKTVDPDSVERTIKTEEIKRLEALLEAYFKINEPELIEAKVCLYTNTQDGHFIIDQKQDSDDVFYVAGLSGHGFKFASGLGKLMKDWILSGITPEHLKFLSRSRFD